MLCVCVSSKYAHERKTSNLGVSYYVRSDFAAAKDANELYSIERQVEEDYVVELQHSCYRERHNRKLIALFVGCVLELFAVLNYIPLLQLYLLLNS